MAATSGFGLTDDGTDYVVDTGSRLVFAVRQSNGDLVSLRYRGVEYQGYDGKNSQVEIGWSSAVVSARVTGDTVVITVRYGTLIHYYLARAGENTIHMATYKPDDSVSMTRYIVRLRGGLLPYRGGNGFPTTDGDGWLSTDPAMEAQDIVRSSDGTTHSKHYSGLRTIDYDYVGRSSGSVGVWMVRSSHERSSGGPFYRSLLRFGTEKHQDLYEIPWYGMAQTEPKRFGLHGPYSLSFTDGGPPSSALFARKRDTAWLDGLGLAGWVSASGRGTVGGLGIAGRDPDHTYTVGLSNAAAQYWTTVVPDTGRWAISGVLPGNYTLTVYKGELEVAGSSVGVTAGSTTTVHTITVSDDLSTAAAIWRIGDWDGTPHGFKNSDLVTIAHPTDVRMRPWTGDYVVGRSAAGDFPCYIAREINNNVTIRFTLTAAQAAQAHILRIGLTASHAGGRPRVHVNDWTSPIPAAPSAPKTRSLTVGTYRQTNHLLTYTVPASAWQPDPAQPNVLTLEIVSGSGGEGWLSPAVSIDAIDLLA